MNNLNIGEKFIMACAIIPVLVVAVLFFLKICNEHF